MRPNPSELETLRPRRRRTCRQGNTHGMDLKGNHRLSTSFRKRMGDREGSGSFLSRGRAAKEFRHAFLAPQTVPQTHLNLHPNSLIKVRFCAPMNAAAAVAAEKLTNAPLAPRTPVGSCRRATESTLAKFQNIVLKPRKELVSLPTRFFACCRSTSREGRQAQRSDPRTPHPLSTELDPPPLLAGSSRPWPRWTRFVARARTGSHTGSRTLFLQSHAPERRPR